MQNKSCFEIVVKEQKRMLIRLLGAPDDISTSMNAFFKDHEQALKSITSPKSMRVLIDIRALCCTIPVVLFHSPNMIAHFLRMTPISNEKLQACAVCVGNQNIADLIQKIVDQHPGEVPTLVSANFDDCKNFLRPYSLN